MIETTKRELKMIKDDDPTLGFLPLENVTKANGYVRTIRNHWWAFHPTKGLVFFSPHKDKSMKNSYPQCNAVENVAKHLAEKPYPWAKIVFVELVLQPIDLKDLC